VEGGISPSNQLFIPLIKAFKVTSIGYFELAVVQSMKSPQVAMYEL